GTTSVRVVAVSVDGRVIGGSQREFTQHFPQPGWVEHDADEIWSAVSAGLEDVIASGYGEPAAIGITNQRETVVLWDGAGRPVGRAIVWQDRRSASICDELAGHAALVRERTGLVVDPYFSGTKLTWLARHGVTAAHFGT